MNATADILRQARDLIAEPEHWCQGAFARKVCGGTVPPGSPDAARWCMLGALMRCAVWVPEWILARASVVLEDIVSPYSIESYNDLRGRYHHEVIAVYNRAIAAADRGEV